jgi:hypothetical protein
MTGDGYWRAPTDSPTRLLTVLPTCRLADFEDQLRIGAACALMALLSGTCF